MTTSATDATNFGDATSSAEVVEPQDDKRWLGLAVIAIAQLMVVLDASIVNIALPSAQADLGIDDANRQWIVTAYTLAFGGLLLLGGRIADYIGRKKAFIIGLIGFAGASALGGFATTQEMLFAARGLQGAFAALLAPAALALITVTFVEPRERAKAFGVYGAIAGGGAALGLILGGILTEYASWHWCLLVNVPVAIIALILAIPLIKESRAEGDRRYDIPGAITSTLGLVFLVYGFTKAVDSWTAPETLFFIGLGILLLVAFVLIELKTSHPLLPMRVVLDRNRGGSFLTSLLVGVALFGMFLFLTIYMQGTLGYSALKSGFAFLPFSAGIIFAAGLASKLLPRFGPRPVMAVGLAMSTVGMAWLTTLGMDSSYVTHILPSELLLSIGMGLTFVPLSSTALTGVEPHDAGVASAMVNTTQQVGGSLGTALLNTIAASAAAAFVVANGVGSIAEAQVVGYTDAFKVGAVIMAVAFVVTVTMINAKPAPEDATATPAHIG